MTTIQLGRAGELPEKRQLARNLLKTVSNLTRLSKRMALKLYLYNSEDEIFKDGTFLPETLEVIKVEAKIVAKALALKREEENADN